MRLVFRREPVVSNGADSVAYGDPFLLSTSFAEIPGGAEFIASVASAGHRIDWRWRTHRNHLGGCAAVVANGKRGANRGASGNPNRNAIGDVSRDANRNFSWSSGSALTPVCHSGRGSWRQRNRSGSFAHAVGEERSIWRWLAVCKKSWRRAGFLWCSPVLPTIYLPGTSARSRRTPRHASLYVALHSSGSGHGARVYTSMVAPAPGETNRSFLPWERAQSPYLEKSGIAASVLAAQFASEGLPVRSSAAPLRPLNSITLAAVAVEVAPLGSIGRRAWQPGVPAEDRYGAGFRHCCPRGKLEGAQ